MRQANFTTVGWLLGRTQMAVATKRCSSKARFIWPTLDVPELRELISEMALASVSDGTRDLGTLAAMVRRPWGLTVSPVVLSFPGPLAVRLGYDTELLGQVCRSFSNRVMQALRRQVKHEHDLATSRPAFPSMPLLRPSLRFARRS